MAEFDEKLNSLLSNPDAMAQIMQLAQSLGGGAGSPPPAGAPPAAGPPPGGVSAAEPPPAQPFWGPPSAASPAAPQPAGGGGDLLSSLMGGLDSKLILRLLPLIQELGGQKDSNARQLLYALRPYLKAERQDKIERALQLARLFHIGRKFLAGWEG
ncbi:MAG: hypothetical protein HFF84_12565 [Oscillibacter sp.]|nr:hypothetical protein [Oscillibacter sp.]